jgi:acetoacetate decarboxylase
LRIGRIVLLLQGGAVKEHDVREKAFATPLTAPAYPLGAYRFIDREYLVIT